MIFHETGSFLFPPLPSEQLGTETRQLWDLRKTVLFRLSPFHPQVLWKLGCLKQPKFPSWLIVPKAPCQGAPSHEPPPQGVIHRQSTMAVLKSPVTLQQPSLPCFCPDPGIGTVRNGCASVATLQLGANHRLWATTTGPMAHSQPLSAYVMWGHEQLGP